MAPRAALTVVFVATGAAFATWASRVPAVQDRLDLSPGELAVAILGIEGGAIAGLPAGGALATRLGSRTALRLGFGAFAPALAFVAVAPGLGWLVVALALMAAGNSVVDVAMNAQGVELERRRGRPLLSGLHAGHSFGLLGGGLAGTAAAGAGIGLAVHFACAAALILVAALAATLGLVDERRPAAGRSFAWPSRRLLLLGVLAFWAFLIDGAAGNWAAVHLGSEHDAGPALAAAAFTAFALALAITRLAGDRIVARLGREPAVRAAGVVSAVGALLVVAAPGAGPAIAGWAVLGAGLAVMAPAVLGAAPEVGDRPAPTAIASVTTIGYLGSFTGPPLIGAAAEVVGLSAALSALVAAGLIVAVLAGPALRSHPR